jgi:hypothetical protein
MAYSGDNTSEIVSAHLEAACWLLLEPLTTVLKVSLRRTSIGRQAGDMAQYAQGDTTVSRLATNLLSSAFVASEYCTIFVSIKKSEAT